MRWWIECLVRELPPVTVNAPRAWHICGTSHAGVGSPSALSRTPVLLIIPSAVDPPGAVEAITRTGKWGSISTDFHANQ